MCLAPALVARPGAVASPVSIQIAVNTSQTLGPIDLTRYGLGQGGLSDDPMISDRVDQITQLHPQTIRLFVQEYFDLCTALHYPLTIRFARLCPVKVAVNLGDIRVHAVLERGQLPEVRMKPQGVALEVFTVAV